MVPIRRRSQKVGHWWAGMHVVPIRRRSQKMVIPIDVDSHCRCRSLLAVPLIVVVDREAADPETVESTGFRWQIPELR